MICIESRPERGWRILDDETKVRTPWLAHECFSETAKKAAMFAVKRTDRNKLTHRHTTDDDWVVVHSY